jgi:hypothetical protein
MDKGDTITTCAQEEESLGKDSTGQAPIDDATNPHNEVGFASTPEVLEVSEPRQCTVGVNEDCLFPLDFSLLQGEIYRKRVFVIRLNTAMTQAGTVMHIVGIDKASLIATCKYGSIIAEVPISLAIENEKGEAMVFPDNIRAAKIRLRTLGEFDVPLMVTSYEPSKVEELKDCYLVVRSAVFEGRQKIEKVWGKRVRKDGEEAPKKRQHYDSSAVSSCVPDQEALEGCVDSTLGSTVHDAPCRTIAPVSSTQKPSRHVVDVMEYINCPQLEWLYNIAIANTATNA